MEKQRIGIIGATGSVGMQACDVIGKNKNIFNTIFVTGHNNTDKLNEIKNSLNAKYTISTLEKDSNKRILDIIANEDIDLVLFAASGVEVLELIYKIISTGITVALANKESIVSAGEIIMQEAKNSGSKIIPVDSEHSAIFQCLNGQRKQYLNKITLTASGGPFRLRPYDTFDTITKEDAIKNPNWSMGNKITIDSATMMNKGLELIEARFLFDVEPSKLDVVVHPESIVHSFVSFIDGATIAQLGYPDMRTPIAVALAYPDRIESNVEICDLVQCGKLTFEKPDYDKFKCLKIAKDVLFENNNNLMTAMNVANEMAVFSFLKDKITFNNIPEIIEEVLNKTNGKNVREIHEVIENIKISKEITSEIMKKFER